MINMKTLLFLSIYLDKIRKYLVFLVFQAVQLQSDVDNLLSDVQPHSGDPLYVVDAVLEDAALRQGVVSETGERALQTVGELADLVLHHRGQC